MDYRELLKKYIKYIVDCEGVDYITACNGMWVDEMFTEEEFEELEKIANEAQE